MTGLIDVVREEECDCVVRLRHPSTPAAGVRAAAMLLVPQPRPVAQVAPRLRRRHIWDLADFLHCSIIGTCLSAGELRRLLRKLGLGRPESTDHELHGLGVRLAGSDDHGGKLLHKTLDARHAGAVRRFGAASDPAALRGLWREAVEAGDIPGAYWAALTHAALDDAVLQDVFGEVHMLSHLVGASNRADIRRLVVQDREIAALRETIERQAERQRVAAAAHDAGLRTLTALRCTQAATAVPTVEVVPDDLRRRVEVAESRAQALEARHAEAEASTEAALRRAVAAESQAGALERELATVVAVLTPNAAPGPVTKVSCSVLYVGGRPNQVPALREGAARLGATLLHHDGGMESGTAQLVGCVGRADLVVFPVDCISHDAALAVKRLCRQAGRPFRPLRSSGVTSFLAALAEYGRVAPAQP